MTLKETYAKVVLASGEVWNEIYRSNGDYILDWKRAACFRVAKDGSRIRSKTYPTATSLSLSILNDLAQAYAGSLRGQESIHATALIPPGASWACAFLGDSGAGKSTLSAHLVGRRWRLLSDDALSLKIRNTLVLVSSSTQRIKLSENSAEPAVWESSAGEYDPNLEKWVFRLPKDSRSYPLRALFLLSRNGPKVPRLRRIRGAEAALILQSSFYNILLRPRRVLRRQFDLAIRLAKVVPVWKLFYPSGLTRLPKICDFLESFVGKLYGDLRS